MADKQEDKPNQIVSTSSLLEKAGTFDAIADLEEVGFDILLKPVQSAVIEQIPILKSAYSLIKAGYAVKDYFFFKKLFQFITGINQCEESLREKLKHPQMSNTERNEITGHVLFTLQRFDQLSKADAFCNLFLAKIDDYINHSDFLRYSRILDRIEIVDLDVLAAFYREEQPKDDEKDILRSFTAHRLISINPNGRPTTGRIFPTGGGGEERFLKNSFGEKFLRSLKLI